MSDKLTNQLLEALECGSCTVCSTTTADGQGLTHCPAHDDQTPSLNVTQDTDRLLLKCHTGCSQTAVLSALRARGLWDRQTTYDYRDVDGSLLFQSVRTETPGQSKQFFQRRPDAKGGWINSTKGVKRVPYRLP